jgi:hypothetical protein
MTSSLWVLPGETRLLEILSIEEAVGELRDPRSRTPAHDLREMLMVALCVILGGRSLGRHPAVGRSETGLAAPLCAAGQRLPSHDTFRRVFAALDARQFEGLERRPQLHAGTFDEYRQCGKDHGRIKTNRCVVQDISSDSPNNHQIMIRAAI